MPRSKTARAIQDMGITQVGIVPGARPEFVYWLTNGKAPAQGTNSQVVVIPVSARSSGPNKWAARGS